MRRFVVPAATLAALAALLLLTPGNLPAQEGTSFPAPLVEADRALRAGESTRALELIRAFQQGDDPDPEYLGLALFEKALASAQLGDMEEAACLYGQATYLNDYFQGIALDAYPSGPELAAVVNPAEPRDLGTGFSRPVGVETVMPEMTDRLRAQMAEAPVVLRTIVTADGRAVVRQVVSSPHGEAALAAIDGVCRWRFEPATNPEGDAVPVWFELTFGGE
jgi:hypothetical protein